MSLFEWFGIIGLGVAAVWAAVRSSKLNWRAGAAWRRGERSGSIAKDWGKDRYVSETTPAYFQYVRRRYRYAVQCPIQYHAKGHTGQGAIVDMTRDGWRVQGQEQMIPGMALRLDLMLPGVMGGVPISRAVVCWARGTEFGVKLETMDARSAAQLREYFSRIPQRVETASKAA